MAEFAVDRAKTAVLAMDFQNEIVERFSGTEGRKMLPRVRAVLDGARQAGLLVVYIVVRFREGYPEVGVSNRGFRAIRDSGRLREGTLGAEVHPELAPKPGDVVVTKRRVSAFFNTDLDTVLRARSIDTLALMGIATSGVVLSTVRYAADADYRLIVLEDCCADGDPEVHALLISKVFPRQATAVSAQEFLREIQR